MHGNSVREIVMVIGTYVVGEQVECLANVISSRFSTNYFHWGGPISETLAFSVKRCKHVIDKSNKPTYKRMIARNVA